MKHSLHQKLIWGFGLYSTNNIEPHNISGAKINHGSLHYDWTLALFCMFYCFNFSPDIIFYHQDFDRNECEYKQ